MKKQLSLFFQSKLKIAYYSLALLTTLCSSIIPVNAYAAGASLQSGATDFTSVAKKAIPAVVAIRITAPSTRTINYFSLDDQFNDQSDLFEDDHWRQFFLPFKRFNRQMSIPQPAIGQASGFIFKSEGYILTNNHVVKDAKEITVTLNDGREFEARIVGQDPTTDLAVLKIDSNEPLPYISLGNSDDLEVGQWVVAIGNPLGLQASLTVGVVSAKGRNNLDIATFEDFIQTDAAINKGNSGGPLLDLDGSVIGINTALVSNSGYGGYIGIGFSIPSNIAKHVVDQLLSAGKVSRGFIGINMQPINQNLAAAFGLNKIEGALIAEVLSNSPAERAGLKQGDIILKYNDRPVTNITALRNAVAMMNPGTALQLLILRDKKQFIATVEVGAFPGQGMNPKQIERMGFDVETLTPDTAQKLGYANETGAIITRVDPNSPAAFAGLKKGAVIVAVNQTKIQNVEEFYRQLEATEKGKPLLILVRQGDSIRFISLRVAG